MAYQTYKKFKVDAKEHIVALANNFKGTNEVEFNKWIFSEGDSYRNMSKQSVKVQSVFVDYLICKNLEISK